jgi:flagellin
VSPKNHARTDRTITINQSDLTPGNVVSVNIGNKEYAVKVAAGDLAENVAYKLSTLIDNDYGGVVLAPTHAADISTFNAVGMRKGDQISVAGLTFTASKTLSQTEVAAAFAGLAANDTDGIASATKYGFYTGKLNGTITSSLTTSSTVTFAGADKANVAYTSRRAVSVGASGSSHVITLGAGLELGLSDISVSVKKITDPGKITITANADTGIGGTSQSIDVGTIAAGSAKSFDFDNLGVSFTLNNSRSATVNAASFEAFTPKVNTLAVESAMDGEALFQVGAGTRDNVILDGFKDIRMTGQNKNVGAEKEVFDKVYETLTTISANTTESLSEANFATLENRIEDAITMVSDFRSYFGGQQNRIEFAIANIQAQSENLTAANSRIVDTDYAAETANLTKTQIMQQAATAMLAQANQMPNVILALLK